MSTSWSVGFFLFASAHCHWPTPALIHRIGKLRSIFSDIGRQGDWNRTLLIGNPASDLLVKQYLKEFTLSNSGLALPPSRLYHFLLTNCFCFLDTSKRVFSSRPFRQLRCLSPPEIKRSARLFSFLVTVAGIWVWIWFPSLTVYFSSCSEDILEIADVVRKETFNIVFHFSVSSYCFLLIH